MSEMERQKWRIIDKEKGENKRERGKKGKS